MTEKIYGPNTAAVKDFIASLARVASDPAHERQWLLWALKSGEAFISETVAIGIYRALRLEAPVALAAKALGEAVGPERAQVVLAPAAAIMLGRSLERCHYMAIADPFWMESDDRPKIPSWRVLDWAVAS